MKLRRWAFQAVLLVIAIISLCVLCVGCRKKQVTIPIPKINPEALRSAAEGDAHLREGHLYGWRQAEAAYQQAYNLAGSEEYKKKLLLSRFLILTRQIDEDIPYSRLDEVIKEICSGDESRKDLCDIAQWYKTYKKLNPPDIQHTTLFGGEQPELEEYFKRLLAQPGNSSPDIRMESAGEPSGESPLLLYLSPGKLETRDPDEIEKTHPGFAEALEYLGESLFQMKYSGAVAMAEKERERRELNYLLDACSCMESGIQQLRSQIDSVPSLDLETREKVLLSSRLRSKLLDYRMASMADIQRMIDNASQTAAVDRETYLKLIREILGRIQKQ
jgi:hypothetical protein